jgi:hypothetical protein
MDQHVLAITLVIHTHVRMEVIALLHKMDLHIAFVQVIIQVIIQKKFETVF